MNQMNGTTWLFRVGKKYHVTHDFGDDLCNLSFDAISVDELIAETLVLLCNKGYITEYSCSGHPYNSCQYTLIEEESSKSDLDAENHIAITDFEDTDAKFVCDIDSIIEDEAYISFFNEHNFNNIPGTWEYSNKLLRKKIRAMTVLDFYQQVIDALRELTDWIHKLPDINI